MPVGLNVFSPSGKLVIDTEKLYYGLVWSGYATLVPGANSPNWSWAGANNLRYDITITGLQFPILYISGFGMLVNVIKNGNITNFQIMGANAYGWTNYRNAMSSNMGVVLREDPSPKCYVFDLMRPNKERFGIEVLSQSGNAVFNSNMSPLNIVASILPPPVQGSYNFPYTKQGYSQWVFDNGTPAQFGEYCSISLANFGLSTARKYAHHIPWSRGAIQDMYYDRYYLWEAVMTGENGWISFTWLYDPFHFLVYDIGQSYYSYIYAVYPNRVAVSLVDVTDMPFPYSY